MPKLKRKEITLDTSKGSVSLKRNEDGVPVISADDDSDVLFGLGWAHAHDRLLAMELTRLIGRGVAAEHLEGSPELVQVDTVMRRHRLWIDSVEQAEAMEDETKALIGAYCDGANELITKNRIPFEFKLIRHRPGPWTPADCILILKMMGLVDLAETQGWLEKFIIQMIQNGASISQVKEMFPYLEEDPDSAYLEIIRKVNLADPIVPPTVKWNAVPRFVSSNNWAVSGAKTASGKPILCGDPHLDTSRLPAIWYEVILRSPDFYFVGGTVPGIPAPALGRSADLAWSPTYGCIDVSDHFIEDVKDGKYRKGDKWYSFDVREETINVRGGDPVKVRFLENEHGVLEQEPNEDGYYLCYSLSMARGCGARDMDNIMRLVQSKSTPEAMRFFALLDFGPFNWVIADKDGNIGYQMSGRCPVRTDGVSGLLPLPGWDENYDWKGYREPGEYPTLFNPPENYIATANQDMNFCSEVDMINVPMGGERASRIAELLEKRDDHDVEGMKKIHYDLYSLHAEKFMKAIRPLLPDTRNGRLLAEWDCTYGPDSSGATLFESIYTELIRTVFGQALGEKVVDYLLEETIIPYSYYDNFDRVLLRDSSKWFGDRSRGEIYRTAVERGLEIEAVRYGSERKILMKNLFFGGRLPGFLGFDYGPIELPGSRGTVSQGQIFTTFGGREATFSPTYRFIADFSEDLIHSCLAGGPSDRRFSKWYTYGIREWMNGVYKRLAP